MGWRPQLLIHGWRKKVELRGVGTDNPCLVIPTIVRDGPRSYLGKQGHLAMGLEEAREFALEFGLKIADLAAEIRGQAEGR